MKKGYVTVYFTLSLGVILSLILALAESARVGAIRMKIECAADTACTSVLAEYHRQLLDQYDLFYIDTSYGTDNPAYANTQAHIRNYMNRNFTLEGVDTIQNYRDILKLSANEVSLLMAAVATDENGIGLKRQAINYEKDKIGLAFAEEIMRNVQAVLECEQESAGLQEQRQEIEAQINEEVKQKEESLPVEKRLVETENGVEEIEVKPQITRDNPADAVNATRGFSILQLVIKDRTALSYQTITPSNYVSGRELHKGSGRQQEIKYPDSFLDTVIFNEFILEKCGSYTNLLDKSLLKYQVEYVIAGRPGDEENLKNIVTRLLLIREAANVLYLLSDGGKMAEIQALSTTLSLIAMMPEIEPLVRYSILFAWAYAESVQDVKILLEKGKVPLVKSSSTWRMSLENITKYKDCLVEGKNSEGLSYEDYLRVLLCLTDEAAVSMRLMDVMEMDIRKTAGNENFRLDGCIDSFEMLAYTKSGYGYEFSIQRKYGYEVTD